MILTSDIPLVLDVLASVRASFDIRMNRRLHIPLELLEEQYLKIERLRFRFANIVNGARYDGKYANLKEAGFAAEELQRSLESLLNDAKFREIAEVIPYARRRNLRVGRQSELAFELDRLHEAPAPAFEALAMLRRALEGGVIDAEPAPEPDLLRASAASAVEQARTLRKIVPTQKIAPVQFAVANGRLAIAPQSPKAREGGAHVTGLAKDDLVSGGERLIEQIRNSNCDKRLLERLEELQEQLERSDNVIQLGFTNITCAYLGKAYEHELPTAVAALLNAHTTGVSMYLAQFPDWISFAEQAAAARVNASDVTAMVDSISQVIATTENSPEIADPEVPKTLRRLKAFMENPASASEKAALAAARTLENLVIAIFKHGADFIEKTATKTADKLSTVAAVAITVTLLNLALSTGAGLGPLAGKVEGMGWINDAVKIVQHQLDTLK